MASTRFSSKLPPDNVIPGFFADWFFEHGHNGTPPLFPGDWLASDRPPLQAGYVLLQRGFAWDTTGLHSQVLGVVLQQLWVIGLWALLLAARVGRVTRGLAIVIVLVSDRPLQHRGDRRRLPPRRAHRHARQQGTELQHDGRWQAGAGAERGHGRRNR